MLKVINSMNFAYEYTPETFYKQLDLKTILPFHYYNLMDRF